MIPGFRTKQSAYVGLAVHHERLSLMKLNYIKKQIVIEGFASVSLPAGSLVDGKVHHPDPLRQAIQQWVEVNQAENCFAALALPVSQVINKKIRVAAYLNDQERHAEISSNLKFYLPGMEDRLYFDFFPVEKHEQEMELQLIAARAAQVETYLQVAQSAGLEIDVVDVDVYAIARSLACISKNFQDEIMVLLDMDRLAAQLVLIKLGKVISVYPIVLESEEIILQQIKRGMQIFSAAVEKILLTGCLADSDKLQQILQAELKIPVQKLEGFKQVVIDADLNIIELNANISELLVAFGLALRGLPRG